MTYRTALLLVSLATLSAAAQRPLKVCVSIPPLISTARSIGRTHVEVTSLLTENDDPHTFSPTPKAVAELGECDLFVTVGVDFERAIAAKLERMFPDLTILHANEGIQTTGAPNQGHAHDAGHVGHNHGAEHAGHNHVLHDPHIWLSIPNLIHIAGCLHDAYVDARPDLKPTFDRNLEHYRGGMTATHDSFRQALAPAQGRTFYVYHPAFGYFARDYGLVQKSVEIGGKSPSPRQLLELITQARRDNVRVIFVQPQFNQHPARILADRINGRIVRLNPLSEDPIDTLQKAVTALVETN